MAQQIFSITFLDIRVYKLLHSMQVVSWALFRSIPLSIIASQRLENTRLDFYLEHNAEAAPLRR
jgi:hypothetical protein